MGTGPTFRFIFNKIKRNRAVVTSTVVGILTLLVATLLCVPWRTPPAEFSSSDSGIALSSWPLAVGISDPAVASTVLKRPTSPPVYPYSVIPGGVRTSQELFAAVRRDSVIAQHYAGFDTRSARLIRLVAARRAYVSYRIAGHIYWTSKKITLHAGEMLLSDGSHLARARCGNRLSEVPGPNSPAEPPAEVFNTPVTPQEPQFLPGTLPMPPVWPDGQPNVLLALNSTQSGPGGFPILPILPFPGGPGIASPRSSPIPTPQPGPVPPTPPGGPLPQPAPTPPPVSTPEPSALLLLLAGLGALFSFWTLRRS